MLSHNLQPILPNPSRFEQAWNNAKNNMTEKAREVVSMYTGQTRTTKHKEYAK